MKKFIAVFLIGVVVIAGISLWHRQSEGIIAEPQSSQTHEKNDALPPMDETAGVKTIAVDITATNAYVLNVDSNTVLYQKNSDKHIAPASTAKMLAALTVLDYCSLDDMFTVGPEIDLIASDSSRAWLNRGDTLTVKQLLAALLIPSGNDAAYTLAVNVGKKRAHDNGLSAQQAIKAFVAAMNQKAKDVGTASSHFITPDGYDADGQYTTAFDLAQIAKACLSHDVLLEIMRKHRINDTWANGREVTFTNTNKLIDPNSPYYYSRVTGLKTGHSEAAGSCLVSAATIDGKTYICVVMGASEETRFSDSLTIFSKIDPGL
jgi:D-alanyl-D-alanine carboxypeptidase (penicillin-binding protein 5/6)